MCVLFCKLPLMWNALLINIKQKEEIEDEDGQLHNKTVWPLKNLMKIKTKLKSFMEEEENEEEDAQIQ